MDTELQLTIKAVEQNGEWVLEVLGVPFGGPYKGGKDAHGEYFHADTRIHEDKFPTPPAVFYHGFNDDGTPSGSPAYLGKSMGQPVKRGDGWWWKVVIDQTAQFASRVWDAAKRGALRVSSGSAAHLVRYGKDDKGRIDEWPVIELSLIPLEGNMRPANPYAVAIPVTKAVYTQAGIAIPDELDQTEGSQDEGVGESDPPSAPSSEVIKSDTRGDDMAEVDIQAEVKAAVADALKAEREAKQVEADQAAAIEAEVEKRVAVKAAELEAEAAKGRRLPGGSGNGAPHIAKFAALRRYDNLSVEEHALMISVLNGKHNDVPVKRASQDAVKSLAIKVAEDKTEAGEMGRYAMKMAGMTAIKADEIMQQDLTGFGDEWVGVSYGAVAWPKIRQGTVVLQKLPQQEIPVGYESDIIPLESTDPTFYKVAEVTDNNGTTGRPNATVTSSKVATDKKQVTLGKMGARVPYSGELNEDSLPPLLSQVNDQLLQGFAEQLEYAIIDGDTDATASTNINDIAGTPTATDLFLLFNGFRKLALVTNTANSRPGGTLDAEDVLATVKLMGTAGMNALDITKIGIIPDLNVYWKLLELAEVKTRDVNGSPTIENGKLTRLYGYDVMPSAFMNFLSATRKANTAGKIDQDTVANNTTGSLLAIRWDQWKFYWKRRLSSETWRLPQADYTEIVMIARCGLISRDNEAAAITYGLTV
jgi:hypothetical protein